MKTRQQMFDAALHGIRAQGYKQAVAVYSPPSGGTHKEPACAYRGENNTKCALGHNIPDNVYVPEIEGCTPSALLDERSSLEEDEELHEHNARLQRVLEASEIPTDDDTLVFLTELQKAHDGCLDYFEKEMSDLAACYRLVYTVPEVA